MQIFQILPQLIEFQKKHLKPNAEAMVISVPTCFHTQYTAGNLHTNDDMSPEPPESILVLEDLRPIGYRVSEDRLLTKTKLNSILMCQLFSLLISKKDLLWSKQNLQLQP